MNIPYRSAAFILLIFVSLTAIYSTKPHPATVNQTTAANLHPKIQVAVLLDVSNSMDGLIEQAKAQLWNMVSVMGKAKCDGTTPQIEIALYEYGRSSNDGKKGYIKQIAPFTSDLDRLSQDLFNLTTKGGEEYCGHVIHTSLNELGWDTSSANYKVIFISGNEDFLQGNISYSLACTEAKRKGVIVNTIYCGDLMQGIKEHWNLAGECGNGSFTNINSNAAPEDIPTPYDSTLITLNEKLNGTYIYYGADGSKNYARQNAADVSNAGINGYASANRIAVKGNSKLYNNSNWDLVDAAKDDRKILDKIDKKTLPDSLRNKSPEQLEAVVKAKDNERAVIQKEILKVNSSREKYIVEERKKRTASSNNTATLETEIEKIIREQAKRFNMKIE